MECVGEELEGVGAERELVKVVPEDSDWLKILKRNVKKLKLNNNGVLINPATVLRWCYRSQ